MELNSTIQDLLSEKTLGFSVEVAKQFGEKFLAEGYKSYEVKGITLREEI